MQTIAVIGATGSMGVAISKRISEGKYKLLLWARDFNQTQLVAKEIQLYNPLADIEAIDCSVNASWEADIIILTVPFHTEKEIAAKIKEVANQKIVISISNPLNETFTDLVSALDNSAAEELQKLLPNSKVIKAFNTIIAADFTTPINDGKSANTFIAGDDHEALKIVSELMTVIGFNVVVAGNLSACSRLERNQLLLN